MTRTLSREYFENVYAMDDDPWNFRESKYEREKYEQTLAILPRASYFQGLEIGCSIGVQTAMLAERCTRLLAIDVSQLAIDRARAHCRHLPNVEFARHAVPESFPAGRYDLTVLSEVGYYLSLLDLGLVADEIAKHTRPLGHLLLVHWIPAVAEFPLSGDQVHQYFLNRPEWVSLAGHCHDEYRIDLLEKRPAGDLFRLHD